MADTVIGTGPGSWRAARTATIWTRYPGRRTEPALGRHRWATSCIAAGHLIQAAVAWQRFAGDGRLLEVVRRLVEHIMMLRAGHPKRHTVILRLNMGRWSSCIARPLAYFLHAIWRSSSSTNAGTPPGRQCTLTAAHKPTTRIGCPVRQSTEVEGHAVLRAAYLTTWRRRPGTSRQRRGATRGEFTRQWRDMVDRKLSLARRRPAVDTRAKPSANHTGATQRSVRTPRRAPPSPALYGTGAC